MSKENVCLIVGDTPATQFLAWRLNSAGSTIILIGPYVSSDGLIAWKTTKLGANFYTPKVFTRNIDELRYKLENYRKDHTLGEIHAMIISAISFEELAKTCTVLSQFSNENTTIFVNGSYGVELEEFVLRYFENKCKCVISIVCEMECRQLSLGSYALVNDEHCLVSIGLSYTPALSSKNEVLLRNSISAEAELSKGKGSVTSIIIDQLKDINWVKIKVYKPEEQLALKIWEVVIPKISLVILSIVHEELDYEKMLLNDSVRTIFENVSQELFKVCQLQCNEKSTCFYNSNSGIIDNNLILQYCMKQTEALNDTTSSEYPEYLSLPFEAYCFYHRLEYPAEILLTQPINLAKRYNVGYSNLNFLFSVYSRLLSMCGLSIKGGRADKSHISFFDTKVGISPSKIEDSKVKSVINDTSTKGNSKKNNKKNNKKKRKLKKKDHQKDKHESKNSNVVTSTHSLPIISSALEEGSGILPPDLENLYLDSQRFNLISPKSPGLPPTFNKFQQQGTKITTNEVKTNNGSQIDLDGKNQMASGTEIKSTRSGSISTTSSDSSSVTTSSDEYEEAQDMLCRGCGVQLNQNSSNRVRACGYDDVVSVNNEIEDDSLSIFNDRTKFEKSRDQLTTLESIGTISLPHFFKRFTPNTSEKKKRYQGLSFDKATTMNLELQIRQRDSFFLTHYDAIGKDALNTITLDKDLSRQHHLEQGQQFWKLKRHYNIYRGSVTIPRATPYDNMLEHLELLNRANAGGILNFTTTRYGEVDTYFNFLKQRKNLAHILKGAHYRFKTLKDNEVKHIDL